MEDLRNSKKRMNQRDTRRKITFRLFLKDSRKMNCTEILSSPSDGQKNIVNIWIRSWQLISHVQLRGKGVQQLYSKDRSPDQGRNGQITRKR